MNKEEVLTLYAYNYWANGKVLHAADQVSPEEYTAAVAGLSFGSLRGTLVHILVAENIWRRRCQEHVSPPALLKEAEFPTMAVLRQRWEEEESAMRAYLATLADSDLSGSLHYTNTRGQPFETPLWQILAHVVNHGTQFRSEAGVALTELGYSPGDTDLIFFLREPK